MDLSFRIISTGRLDHFQDARQCCMDPMVDLILDAADAIVLETWLLVPFVDVVVVVVISDGLT